MNKKPRFFCDNCGAEVPFSAKSCPQCGRFFASVRCPACGFSAEEKAFASGCPQCGYSAPPTSRRPMSAEKKVPAGPLPPWVYVLSIAALLLALGVLFFVLAK